MLRSVNRPESPFMLDLIGCPRQMYRYFLIMRRSSNWRRSVLRSDLTENLSIYVFGPDVTSRIPLHEITTRERRIYWNEF